MRSTHHFDGIVHCDIKPNIFVTRGTPKTWTSAWEGYSTSPFSNQIAEQSVQSATITVAL